MTTLQGARGFLHPASVQPLHVDEGEQHQREGHAAQQHQRRRRIVGQILEFGAAADAQEPGMAGDDGPHLLHVACLARSGLRCVEETLRPARAIEDLQLQVGNGGFEDMPDDILRPEGAINKPEQGPAPCLDGIDRRTVAVDRLIDEEAGLIGALALLHEDHLAGHRRLARIAGAFHRRPPDRLGEHVVTKSAPVGGREGLEVNDGAENRAIAGG
jgi:hypothetical protein